MKQTSKILSTLFLAAIFCLAQSCGKFADQRKGNTSTSGLTTIMCDNSFENIIQQEIDVFEYVYPEASIIPYYVSEAAAIDSLISFKTRLAVISRELTKEETEYLKGKKRNPKVQRIAVDAIALIVNPENPVEILSKSEISDILSGEVTDWNQIEPSKIGKINVVFDDPGSSTLKYMKDSLLQGKELGENVYAQGSNRAVFEAVKKSKNTVGVIGVSWITTDMKGVSTTIEDKAQTSASSDTTTLEFNREVKVLKIRRDDSIEAYKPYQAYIYSGQYPLFRSIYMVCASVSGTTSHGFYSFVTGFQGQKLIQMTGVLPATIQPRMVALY
ncbi:MAG: PstS family phosphate ABC transporter substrate-binding protein [Muribaculaceae bacterium]